MNLPVSKQEKSLFRQMDEPVFYDRIDLRQGFRLPLGDSTEQQVKESAAFDTVVAFTPQERPLIFGETGEGDKMSTCLQKNVTFILQSFIGVSTHK